MQVASYNLLYDKTLKEYKNTEMKIWVNYIDIPAGLAEPYYLNNIGNIWIFFAKYTKFY